jgi:hypothetical protein
MHRHKNLTLGFGVGIVVAALVIMGVLLMQNGQSDDATAVFLDRTIPHLDEARIYADVIAPILQARCHPCHGPQKQKGALRMDIVEKFIEGGEEGAVFIAGKPEESPMIKRILLDRNDDDHMPPKDQPQLSKAEVTLLQWWITTGASFDKSVNALNPTENVKSILVSLQKPTVPAPQTMDLPAEKIDPASARALQELKDAGVLVLPIAKDSNYLEANFLNAGHMNDQTVKLLEPLAQQLVRLNLSGTAITDSACAAVARLTRLRKLHLLNTRITDAGLAQLHTLTRLQYLNLVGTVVTAKGLAALSGWQDLQQLYLYQTSIDSSGLAHLRRIFPQTQLDIGGYKVATLATDTSEVKPPKPH